GRSDRQLGPGRDVGPDAARWFGLAVGALAVSGVFSLILVVGRIPATAAVLMPDPLLAQRSLVVHVNLAMGVWFFSCIAGLFCLLPGRRPSRRTLWAQGLAVVGVVLLIIPTFFSTAEPILSNYV